jgi:hypothetical protein
MSIFKSLSFAATCLAFAAVGVVVSPAKADVINFSGLGSTFGGVTSYTQDGMTFTDSTGFVGPNVVQNNFAGSYGSPATITVTNAAGSGFTTFNFTSEEFSMYNNADPASGVTFTGHTINGTTVTESFVVPGDSTGISTFTLTGFTNLTSLQESIGFVSFQDFTFTPGNATVPEPATTALIGLGLLGFAVARRKSGNNNA